LRWRLLKAGAVAVLGMSLVVAARPQTARRSTTTETLSPPDSVKYAGDAACQSCHAAEFASYQATGHHLTSQLANAQSVAGNFSDGKNVFKTSNPFLSFRMTEDAQRFHETAVDEVAPGKKLEVSEPLDLVVGSGRKAQTYLYWKNDLLFELPVTYWIESGQWVNSPGYEDGTVRFDRAIYPRCLECHGSSFVSQAPPPNRYEKSSVVLGISCERCHGPGKAHVALYSSARPPAKGGATGIVNPAKLSRGRNMDTCAICHAGVGTSLAPALSYVPGAPLEKYLKLAKMDAEQAIDVHGNQVQLLESSRCYLSSQMTCVTCHNVHTVQRDTASYSHYCLDCHQAKQCGKFATMGEAITKNCVDCHMPLKKSNALFSSANQQTLQLPVRTHRIAVY
jgi:hypothetical protein